MVSVQFQVNTRFFSMQAGGNIAFKPPAQGTQYLGGLQRMLGMMTGQALASDTIGDKVHRGASGAANARMRNTIQNAWSDGVLTRAERNQINDSRRDAGIARQRVGVDNYRKAYGRAMKDAYQDGKITPQERQKLRGMRCNLRRMQGNLRHSIANDRRMERSEGIQNKLFGNQVVGFNPRKFIQNLGFASCGQPSMGQVGGQTCHHCGHPPAAWQCPPRPPVGHPRGSQYLNWGQQLGGMCVGHQLAKTTCSDVQHRQAAGRAQNNYRNTVKNAWSDGILTLQERNQIRNAGREMNMANARVGKDNCRRAYGQKLKAAYADGVITPQERQELATARGNINRMQGRLQGLQRQDQVMDRFESFQNAFAGNTMVGFNPGQFLKHLLGV